MQEDDRDGHVSVEVKMDEPKSNLLDPKRWPLYKFRVAYREYLAQFWGTFFLLFFGNSTNAATFFNAGQTLDYQTVARYLSLTIAWGFGLTLGLYVSMGISGGHLNPAVTVTNAIFGAFPWRKVPGYIVAQFCGAMVGAASMYALFRDHFNTTKASLKPNETMTQKLGGLFCTYPNISNSSAVWSEFICTAVLMLAIFGINDERMTPAVNHKPIAVGLLVVIIGLAPGWCTGYAMNPARDFGPRLVTVFLWGSEPLTLNNHYFVIPLLVPFLGAFAGALFYVLTVVSKVD